MLSILHVDDEPDFSEIIKLFLESMDNAISFDHVPAASRALKILETRSYDIIISDYSMPGKNGLDFLRELRKRGDNTPFIMLTGKGSNEVEILAFNLGIDYFFQKTGHPALLFVELYQAIVELSIEKEKRLNEKDYLTCH